MKTKNRNRRPGKSNNKLKLWNEVVAVSSLSSTLGSSVKTIKIPFNSVPLSSVITTGLIAYEGQISPVTVVGNWATRFGTTFDEYRVICARIELHPVGIYTGETAFFLAETSLGTPTLFEVNQRMIKLINNNVQVNSGTALKWRAVDLSSDLQWRDITTGYNGCRYYVYTDTANFGAPAVATLLWIVRGVLTIQFRGERSA